MKRVAVVGCPGAGKTTFSRRLAKETGLPLVYLDFYYHDKNHDYEHDRDAWIKRVEKLTTKSSWIIDGNYRSTFPLRFSRADTIFFIDLPRRIPIYRILKRRFEYRNRLRTDMPKGWRERIDWGFLRFVWQFNKYYRPDIVQGLKVTQSTKVVIFKSSQEAELYLQQLGKTNEVLD